MPDNSVAVPGRRLGLRKRWGTWLVLTAVAALAASAVGLIFTSLASGNRLLILLWGFDNVRLGAVSVLVGGLAVAFLIAITVARLSVRRQVRRPTIAISVVAIVIVLPCFTVFLLANAAFSVREYVELDMDGEPTSLVVRQVSGLGDVSYSLFSGDGLLYRPLDTPMPSTRQPFSPFRAGDYKVTSSAEGYLIVSYALSDGGEVELVQTEIRQ